MTDPQFYEARLWLTANVKPLCLRHGPASWVPTHNPFPVEAGDSIRGLAWVYKRCLEHVGLPFPVYAGHSSRSIYLTPEANVTFRAWHDAVHCEYYLGFKPGEELEVARLQIEQARAYGASDDALEVLRADIVGQVQYYVLNDRFPDDQLGFVRAYVNNPHVALEGDWR